MEVIITALLSVAAFILAAIPFSLFIGRWFLHDDIRKYGDGNPGAANVIRAGGFKLGLVAVFLDVSKGVPFVLLAHAAFGLPELSLVIVATSAILGHAFSPFLQLHGGKAIAVTFGVLLALPQYHLLLAFIACLLLALLIVEVDAWIVVGGASGTLVYAAIAKGGSWETLLIFCILVVLVLKHFEDLHTFPGFRGRLWRWLQAVLRGTISIM